MHFRQTTRIINGQDLDSLLREVYDENVVNGNLWENTYAGTNHEEMWAEAVQSYYSVNAEGPVGGDGVSNHIWSHDLLADYDPKLYKIIEDVFPSDVDFSCPTTSFDDCDCTRIRQLCTQAGVPLPSTSTNPPINPPTDRPTTMPGVSSSFEQEMNAGKWLLLSISVIVHFLY